jgi:outer membrane lipoprotein-sorting protein
LLLAVTFLAGQVDLTVRDIAERNYAQMNTADESADFIMRLIDKRGRLRERQVLIQSKTDASGQDKSLIRFQAPADVRGVGLLSLKQGDQENQWLYLPSMGRIRRISASQETDSFMGSDFSYEDIQRDDVDDYTYILLKEEVYKDMECYVVHFTPFKENHKKQTGYRWMDVWIWKDSFLTVKIDFFDRRGELLKSMTADDIRPIGKTGKWRAYFVEMQNNQTGHRTELQYNDIRVDQDLHDDVFTIRSLERGF